MLTAKQWQYIILNSLGLRSGATNMDIGSAASYSMDMGVAISLPLPGIPPNWMDLLKGTIKFMKGFPNSDTRFLLIVSRSTGNSYEYKDCFPKCSVKPSVVHASTSLAASEEELVEWVLNNIPS